MDTADQHIARSPSERYQTDLQAGSIEPDAAQAHAIEHIDRVYRELRAARDDGGWVARLWPRNRPRWRTVRGLYLWGSVGRGKTYIVDTFYEELPLAAKMRIHFHAFMRRTHGALQMITEEADPLKRVAREWAQDHRVICLDEFHVGDITDAMLLANLLQALFDQGVTVLATSNEAPDDLYRGGLQRSRFLPAIELIKTHMDVYELSGQTDYRLRALEQAPVYYLCPQGAADASLERSFSAIAPEIGTHGTPLAVEGRNIPTVRLADGVVWFTFGTLCGGARSTLDYIEIARCHHTVILSDVPALGSDNNDEARRFINLVDELYDRHVNLILSAVREPEDLYEGARLSKPFRRTTSRLREMRSHDYLATAHISD